MTKRLSLFARTINASAEHLQFMRRLEGIRKRANKVGMRIKIEDDVFKVHSKPRTAVRALFEDEQGAFIVSSNNLDRLEAFIEGAALMINAYQEYAGVDVDLVTQQIGMRKTMEALQAKNEEDEDEEF